MQRLQFDKNHCLIIAEVAQNHDGSLGTAHAYIDAVARTGADAIKFQTHIAAAESSPSEPWRVKFSRQDATRYEYWQRMEFTESQWAGLAEHARERNLLFLSSPFSIEAAELLMRTGVAGWKIASGEVGNEPMLRYLISTGLPFLVSSGMSPYAELDNAVARVQAAGLPLCVFQCTTSYPCPPEKIGLNLLSELAARYGCPAGLSDHSGTIFPSLAAATLGAGAIEIHVTLSRECFGPDVPASVTTAELRQLVDGVRFIERMMANPVKKDAMAEEMSELRNLFTKSIVFRRDLAAGATISEDDLTVKKPGTGIPANRLHEFVGMTLARPVATGHYLEMDDVRQLTAAAAAGR